MCTKIIIMDQCCKVLTITCSRSWIVPFKVYLTQYYRVKLNILSSQKRIKRFVKVKPTVLSNNNLLNYHLNIANLSNILFSNALSKKRCQQTCKRTKMASLHDFLYEQKSYWKSTKIFIKKYQIDKTLTESKSSANVLLEITN